MLKKRLLLILFLATVLIYAMALFWSIQAYEEWKRHMLEATPRTRMLKPKDYFSSEPGRFMIFLGAIMGFTWLMTVVVLGIYQAKKLEIDEPEKRGNG